MTNKQKTEFESYGMQIDRLPSGELAMNFACTHRDKHVLRDRVWGLDCIRFAWIGDQFQPCIFAGKDAGKVLDAVAAACAQSSTQPQEG